MYVQNGIAYAGEPQKPITVAGVRPLADHQLWIRFSTGEIKLFDFRPLLEFPSFQPLKDVNVFNGVYIDYGVCVWLDGDVDISPEYLYEHSETVKEKETA